MQDVVTGSCVGSLFSVRFDSVNCKGFCLLCLRPRIATMNAERSRAFVTSVVLATPVADMMRSMGLRRGATDRVTT